jgi:hypothetical protein
VVHKTSGASSRLVITKEIPVSWLLGLHRVRDSRLINNGSASDVSQTSTHDACNASPRAKHSRSFAEFGEMPAIPGTRRFGSLTFPLGSKAIKDPSSPDAFVSTTDFAAIEYCMNTDDLAIDCIIDGKRKSLRKTTIVSKNDVVDSGL